ncbi:MAG: hypothetical protein D6698_12810 [Gammaproteobacteria bacterium]|nr:MAG: hypothetical protein D6698_12810 [Gammaproteobacteria bacterium]
MTETKLEKFVEGLPLDAKVKKELMESLHETIKSIKEANEADLRKEFAEKYDNDMKTLKEGVAELMEAKITAIENELKETKAQHARDKVSMAKRLAESQKKMEADYKRKRALLESTYRRQKEQVRRRLAEELEANKKTVVSAIAEVKARGAEERKKLVKRAATIVEKVVTDHLRASIEPLMEDIQAARKKKFGMELYEAFEKAYVSAFLQRNDPVRKMIAESNREKVALAKQLNEAKKEHEKAIMEAKMANKKAKQIREKALREAKMATLLSKLPTETARRSMKVVLESVATEKLDEVFHANKPHIIREDATKSRRRATLTESEKPAKIKKVGFESDQDIDLENDKDIIELRKRIGVVK